MPFELDSVYTVYATTVPDLFEVQVQLLYKK